MTISNLVHLLNHLQDIMGLQVVEVVCNIEDLQPRTQVCGVPVFFHTTPGIVVRLRDGRAFVFSKDHELQAILYPW